MKIVLFVFGMFISRVTCNPTIPKKLLLINIKDKNPADIRSERLENTIPSNGRSIIDRLIRMQVEKIRTKLYVKGNFLKFNIDSR